MLEVFKSSSNQIEQFPVFLSNLKKLQELNLEGNCLCKEKEK